MFERDIHGTDIFAEARAFNSEVKASEFLESLGSASVRYYQDADHMAEHVDEAFKENPDTNLVLLDGYRILDASNL